MTKPQVFGATILGAVAVFGLSYFGTQVLKRPADVNIVESGSGDLAVHITGAVEKPGLYHFPKGTRVDDALRKAGLPADAEPNRLNLARKLEDGMQVRVPRNGEPVEEITVDPSASKAVGLMSNTGGDSGQAKPKNAPAGTVSLNRASLEELDTLPGVGPAIGKKIIEYRNRTGGFRTIEEIMEVSGIGPKKFAAMKDYLRL